MNTKSTIYESQKKLWIKPSVKTIAASDLSACIKAAAWSGMCEKAVKR